MKTVCFVVSSFPRVSETFITNHIIHAKLKGYGVLLLVKKKLPLAESSQKELIIKHDLLKHVYTTNYKIPSATIQRRIKALVYIIRYLKYWLQIKDLPFRKRFTALPFQLAFYSQFKDVSIFHIQFATAGSTLMKMKSIGLLKGDIITTFHGYDAHYKNQEELKALKLQYNLLFKESRYLTVNTVYLAKKIVALGAPINKIKVISMGIDLSLFKPEKEKIITKNTVVSLISIGRLIALKGFAYAIKSVKIIVDKGYNVNYTIIGEGTEMDNLKQLIQELKLMDHVFLLGVKNQIEIKSILEESHIFLMSSITDQTNRAEAQGVVTAEAQAMGLPVVAFNSGGVPYTILDNETGFLVLEKDVTGYADGIIKLLDNPSLYAKMSNSSKKFASNNFSMDVLASIFFKLYE
ncbi:glycosyltransferase [Lacinutrix cladophorae]